MEEYEYSFQVESIKPYINYCEKNQYLKKSEVTQNRIVYRNKKDENIIARITTTFKDGNKETFFDFKNVDKNHNFLKISNESIPLKVTEENEESIYSILKVLNFYEGANNIRTRYVYEKKDVTFEIDEYKKPEMQVVAIEGKREEVDKVYKEISSIINNVIE